MATIMEKPNLLSMRGCCLLLQVVMLGRICRPTLILVRDRQLTTSGRGIARDALLRLPRFSVPAFHCTNPCWHRWPSGWSEDVHSVLYKFR